MTDSGLGMNDEGVQPIDGAAGLANFMGRTELYEKMLRRFLELNLDSGAVLREAWARGEREEAGRQAHSMASAAGTLGALELASVAAGLDRALRSGSTPEAIRPWVDRYEASCARVIAALQVRFS